MQGSIKKSGLISYVSSKDEIGIKKKGQMKFRSSSSRNFSQSRQCKNQRRLENLSLARHPASPASKSASKIMFFSQNKPSKLQALTIQLEDKLRTIEKNKPNEYFNACKHALKALIKVKHPISELLERIQRGYEQKINENSNLYDKGNVSLKHTLFDSKNHSSSIFNRAKKRKSSRRLLKIPIDQEISDFSPIPKLNFKQILIAKQENSEKITCTRDDTGKPLYFQDYQDEFMAKYEEFSESWRKQIRENKHYAN